MGFWDKAWKIVEKAARATVKVVAAAISVMADIGERVVTTVSKGLKRVKKWANLKLGVMTRRPMRRPAAERTPQLSSEERLKNIFDEVHHTVRLFHEKLEQLSETKEGYEEYLRLMVVRKLLVDLDKLLQEKQTLDMLTVGDIEICNSCNLLLNGQITDEQIRKLDETIIKICGKNILVVGTEQIFFLWKQEEEDVKSELKLINWEIASNELDITSLSKKSRIEGLSRHEDELFARHKARAAELQSRLSELRERRDNLTYMVGATEGLLRVYEQREDNLAKIAVAHEVAQIMVDWHRTNTVTAEQRARTEIFARMHLRSAQERNAAILEEMA